MDVADTQSARRRLSLVEGPRGNGNDLAQSALLHGGNYLVDADLRGAEDAPANHLCHGLANHLSFDVQDVCQFSSPWIGTHECYMARSSGERSASHST